MSPMEIGTAERLQAEDIVWRHVWLKSVLIDNGKPFPAKIHPPGVARRMSLTRRLEKFTGCERPSNRSDHGWQGSLQDHSRWQPFFFLGSRFQLNRLVGQLHHNQSASHTVIAQCRDLLPRRDFVLLNPVAQTSTLKGGGYAFRRRPVDVRFGSLADILQAGAMSVNS
jgi:hypothetical protein